jgi:hypothetical protein
MLKWSYCFKSLKILQYVSVNFWPSSGRYFFFTSVSKGKIIWFVVACLLYLCFVLMLFLVWLLLHCTGVASSVCRFFCVWCDREEEVTVPILGRIFHKVPYYWTPSMSSVYGLYLLQEAKLYTNIKQQLLFFGYTSDF